MDLILRFKTAAKRRAEEIARSDAAMAAAAAARQAENDALSLRERTRPARIDAATVQLADLFEPLVKALESLDVDYWDRAQVVLAALRVADTRSGLCDSSLHMYERSPSARALEEYLNRPHF